MFIINPHRFTTAPLYHTNSVDLDGSTETMLNSTDNTLGIANTFSIQAWVTFTDANRASDDDVLTFKNSSNNNNRIILRRRASQDDVEVFIFDSSGGTIKRYVYDVALVDNTRYQIGFTWNGTNLILYFNGSANTPASKPNDTTGTMTDTGRQVALGRSITDATVKWHYGKISRVDVWSVVLSASAWTDIYASGTGYGLDLTQTVGSNYTGTETAALEHSWLLGKQIGSASLIGTDYGNGTTINVGTNALNISDADVVAF